VADAQLDGKLARKLRYVRAGYDITFDYFALNVKGWCRYVEGRIEPALAATKLSPTSRTCPE